MAASLREFSAAYGSTRSVRRRFRTDRCQGAPHAPVWKGRFRPLLYLDAAGLVEAAAPRCQVGPAGGLRPSPRHSRHREVGLLVGAVALLLAELSRGAGGGITVSRLLEIFCAEAFRAEHATGEVRPSWFRGLADPKISEAIRMIHADPGRVWTVDSLAKRVALSPSRFAARFREATGDSVMRYVAVWRANVACRFLRESEMSLSEVAHRVGYESLPVFSRAFKEQLGMPPAAWRASSRGSDPLRK